MGTTVAAGYIVGMSTGRPEGTTLKRGYDVGIDFSGCNLLTDWDVLLTILNVNDLCTKLSQEINIQCAFDQQPLTK